MQPTDKVTKELPQVSFGTMTLLLLLCCFTVSPSHAATSLWKVSQDDHVLYIGGTIHVLRADDYPLPPEYEQAYELADTIAFETDLSAPNTVANQKLLAQRLQYPPGNTLQDHLSAETYRALSAYVNASGLAMEVLNQFKPSMTMMTLIMTELTRLGMAHTGVDMFFWQKAIQDGKAIGVLESIETQFELLENLGQGYEDELILSTLNDLKTLPAIFHDMTNAWRQGDLKHLAQIAIDQMKTDYPSMFQVILIDRNNAWLPQIEAWLQTPEIEMVLVGALHLATNDGLIAKLRAKGYRVELFKRIQ